MRFKLSMKAALAGLFAVVIMLFAAQASFAQTDAKPNTQEQAQQETSPPTGTEDVPTEVPPLETPAATLEIIAEVSAYDVAVAARRRADHAMEEALKTGDSDQFAAAVEARKKADQAISTAVMQQENVDVPDTSKAPTIDKAEGKNKKSFNADALKASAMKVLNKILSWLTSAAFLVMVAAVVLGYYLARYLTKKMHTRVDFLRDNPQEGKFLRLKKIGWQLRDLVFPALLIAIFAIASPILKNVPMLGQDWLVKIAQGLAVVFLLYTAIRRFVVHPIVQKLVIWIAIPIAVLKVFGWYDNFQKFMMEDAVLELGNIKIPAWSIMNLLIFGGILFWIGRISNNKGKEAIRSQDSIDGPTRELFAKIFEMMIFAALIVLLMGIAGIPMTSLMVLGAPLMLGIGFGMQGIAANFISGMILLLDRTLKIGDYVVLPDGQEGYVEAMNMRSATVETTDGKDIMVPNNTFIESAYENWTHKDPRQRYEVYFSVGYGTDVDALEGILIPAISKHPQVLQEPEKPDLELREFADSGIKFAIEFWADGIDDGENKFTSDLNFIVWRTLKKHGIEMPLPQREVRMLK